MKAIFTRDGVGPMRRILPHEDGQDVLEDPCEPWIPGCDYIGCYHCKAVWRDLESEENGCCELGKSDLGKAVDGIFEKGR